MEFIPFSSSKKNCGKSIATYAARSPFSAVCYSCNFCNDIVKLGGVVSFADFWLDKRHLVHLAESGGCHKHGTFERHLLQDQLLQQRPREWQLFELQLLQEHQLWQLFAVSNLRTSTNCFRGISNGTLYQKTR